MTVGMPDAPSSISTHETMISDRSRPRWAKVLLLIVATGVGFLFCEIGTRVFLRLTSQTLAQSATRAHAPDGDSLALCDIVTPSANPRLIYELLPNRHGRFQGTLYRPNSHGMRGGEVALEKPKNVWRIAALTAVRFRALREEREGCPRSLESGYGPVGKARNYGAKRISPRLTVPFVES